MNSAKSGIYLIESQQTGRHYVGQSVSVYTRWTTHKRDLKNQRHTNPILQRIYNKYGLDDLVFIFVKACDPSQLDNEECIYIDHYQSMVTQGGMNIMQGGRSGTRAIPKTDEHKEKVADTHRKRYLSRHGIITALEAAHISGLPYKLIQSRLKINYTVDQAMDKGPVVSIKALAKNAGVDYSTVRDRISRGYTLEQALK